MREYYLTQLTINFCILLGALFLIFEMQRCWFVMTGKPQNLASDKILEFVQMPFETIIKNKTALKWFSFFAFPIAFGITAMGYLAYRGMPLGMPWGYVAVFGMGYFGASIILFVAVAHKFLTSKIKTDNSAGYLMMLYFVLLMGLAVLLFRDVFWPPSFGG